MFVFIFLYPSSNPIKQLIVFFVSGLSKLKTGNASNKKLFFKWAFILVIVFINYTKGVNTLDFFIKWAFTLVILFINYSSSDYF